jgi:diguanylate cyclase
MFGFNIFFKAEPSMARQKEYFMKKNEEIVFLNRILFPKTSTNIVFAVAILLSLPLIWLFVYKTGGIKFVFSHTMYLPIIISSVLWGVKSGLFIAITGGLLLGPLMPLDVLSGENQVLINWLFRLMFFVLISLTVGLIGDKLKQSIIHLKYASEHNDTTGLLNMKSLNTNNEIIKMLKNPYKKITIVSILWNNYDDLINTFGFRLCTDIVIKLDKRFLKVLQIDYKLLQSGSSSFFLLIGNDNYEFIQEQINDVINTPVKINNIPFHLDFSIGLAVYSQIIEKNINSFQKANIASLYSKKSGISSTIFDDKNISVDRNNLLLLGEFRKALVEGQTTLHYQPKIDLNTRKPIGMEALIRWLHPQKGMIAPMRFIPLVEETILINPLTEFVLNQSLMQIKEFSLSEVYQPISINISPKNLLNPQFYENVVAIFDKHKTPTHLIEFEITESALMCDPEKANIILNNLKIFNIKISIDDFGTGYSSLAYLSRFPIDILKMDQYFIKQLFQSNKIRMIVRSTITLAHDLGMQVIAEGIEDEETEAELIKFGCDMGQGYLYSKPLSDKEILTWIKDH